MTIIVHHLENSRSQRILWMLEELGLPYEVKRYERDRKTMLAPPELRRIHPLGKSPVIVDTDDDGPVRHGCLLSLEAGQSDECAFGNQALCPVCLRYLSHAKRACIQWLKGRIAPQVVKETDCLKAEDKRHGGFVGDFRSNF